ncbi:class I SAM-dependent DNA methyltransferase [Streptomyces boninensis]|uniref:class I SAM-dependent DNA methyltransferase n=1 Tax=Streptomyces boninensis TaxID=2039455 RepID=UPI003B21EBD2
MPAHHNLDHERALWDTYAEAAFSSDAEPSFCWTQYAGHGPGTELLNYPASVLELGCGTGRMLAHLAAQGIKARGVDLSPVMVAKVNERWAHTGLEAVCDDVLTHLLNSTETYDAIYSIFGAVWFTDPAKLFPLAAARLNPGGVFAFSHPPAIPGAYGPQGMYKGGFAGRAQFTYRYSYTPRKWCRLLTTAGFAETHAEVLDAPQPDHIGTLIVRAVAP